MNLLVAGAVAATAEDIRGIRGPIVVAAARPWGLYIALVALALLLVSAGVYAWRVWRARPVSAYQRAKAQLTAAAIELEKQRPDVFAERVSDAVREYVQARFGLPATQRTSEEFLSDLLVREDIGPQLLAQRPLLTSFLASCDFAKFAGRALHAEAMRAMRSAALQFIDAAESARPGVAT